ncbi:MAG: SAM-dependent methyltransferase, partial [Clostridiales bacterium]|nr:SAM-dependent methyltransferase [Clostridiales bacterium]
FPLVELTASLLSDSPLFFLMNSYTTGFQASVLHNLLSICIQTKRGGTIDAQELCLPVTSGTFLPCGTTGRWSPNEK